MTPQATGIKVGSVRRKCRNCHGYDSVARFCVRKDVVVKNSGYCPLWQAKQVKR